LVGAGQFQLAAIIMTLVYIIFIMVLGYIVGKREAKDVENFYVGGRRIGTLILFFTLIATIIGAASTVGYTAWFWIRGFSQLWFTIGAIIGYLIYVIYMNPRIWKFGKKTGAFTITDFLEYRYQSRLIRYIAGLLIAFAYAAITAFQFMAMGKVLHTIFGIPYEWGVVISAIIVIVYTSFGGFWSVAMTDLIQGILTFIGVIVLFCVAVATAGGFGNILASVPPKHLSLFGYVTPVQALAWILVFLLGIMSWPDLWQRVYSGKDLRTVNRSWIAYVISILAFTLLVGFIGLAGRVLYPNIEDPETLFPTMAMDLLGLGGVFVLLCLYAIIMGTADSCLLVSVMHFVRDIYQYLFRPKASDKEILKASRIGVIVVGVLVLVLALVAPSIFDLWVMSADITGATLAFIILFGWRWKRGDKYAGLASILLGFIGWALGYLGYSPWGLDPIIFGGILSLIALIVVGYLRPPVPKEIQSLIDELWRK